MELLDTVDCLQSHDMFRAMLNTRIGPGAAIPNLDRLKGLLTAVCADAAIKQPASAAVLKHYADQLADPGTDLATLPPLSLDNATILMVTLDPEASLLDLTSMLRREAQQQKVDIGRRSTIDPFDVEMAVALHNLTLAITPEGFAQSLNLPVRLRGEKPVEVEKELPDLRKVLRALKRNEDADLVKLDAETERLADGGELQGKMPGQEEFEQEEPAAPEAATVQEEPDEDEDVPEEIASKPRKKDTRDRSGRDRTREKDRKAIAARALPFEPLNPAIAETAVAKARAACGAMLAEKKYDREKAFEIANTLFFDLVQPYAEAQPQMVSFLLKAADGTVSLSTAKKWWEAKKADPDYLATFDPAIAGNRPPAPAVAYAGSLIADKDLAAEAANYLAGIPWKGRKTAQELIALPDTVDISFKDLIRLARCQQHCDQQSFAAYVKVSEETLKSIIAAQTRPKDLPGDEKIDRVAENLGGIPAKDAPPLAKADRIKFRQLATGTGRDAGEKLRQLVLETPLSIKGLERARMFNRCFLLLMQREALRDRYKLRDEIVAHPGNIGITEQEVYSAFFNMAGPSDIEAKLAKNADVYANRKFSATATNKNIARAIAAYAFPDEDDDARKKFFALLTTRPPRDVTTETHALKLLERPADGEGQSPP